MNLLKKFLSPFFKSQK